MAYTNVQSSVSRLLTRRIFPALVYGVAAIFIGSISFGGNLSLAGGPAMRSVHAAVQPCDGCERTFEIGRSVQGRPIIAYQFGEGKHPVVYLGGMHGDEGNSQKIMEQWRDRLRTASKGIFRDRSVVIIPAVNPDGTAAGSRLNAHGVDLNRNFAAKDWKGQVSLPNQPQPTGAGGRSPLSEPESKALAGYLQAARPRLVLSYHSKAAVTEANEAGASKEIAEEYAKRAGYRAVPTSKSHTVFNYDTTGSMEGWLCDEHDIPAIVVELAGPVDSEYARNEGALWYAFRR